MSETINAPVPEVQQERIPKTDEELKQLAVDLVEDKVFCDRYIQPFGRIESIFLPIMLGAFSDIPENEINDKVNFIYEYYDKAGPRSDGTHPQFFSLNFLGKDEFQRMMVFYNEYKAMKENFTAKPKQESESA